MRAAPRRIAVAAVAAIAVATALIIAPASEPEAEATPVAANDAIAEQQEAVLPYAEQIQLFDRTLPESRLGTVAFANDAASLEVGWVGEVPAALQAIADDAKRNGHSITFVEQRASSIELADAALAIAAALPDGAFGISLTADSIRVELPLRSASQRAGVTGVARTDANEDRIDEAARAVLPEGVTLETVSVPDVPLAAYATTAPLATDRRSDRLLVNGGMSVRTQFRSGNYIYCSSGFTAFQAVRPIIITAAHCSDYLDNRNVQNGNGANLGRSTLVAQLNDGPRSLDMGAISLASVDTLTNAQIYTSQTNTLRISDALVTRPPIGTRLCSAGITTGWHCDLTASSAFVVCYSASHGNECVNTQLVNVDAGNAFCGGDSGGPIVTNPRSNASTAVGVISGYRDRVTGTTCGRQGIIAPLGDLMELVYGVQLHVRP